MGFRDFVLWRVGGTPGKLPGQQLLFFGSGEGVSVGKNQIPGGGAEEWI